MAPLQPKVNLVNGSLNLKGIHIISGGQPLPMPWEKPKPAASSKNMDFFSYTMCCGKQINYVKLKEEKKKKKEDSKEPELQKGWRAAKDENSGRTYYYHETTGLTTWEKPKYKSTKKKGLPDGWRVAKDENTGDNYYFHIETGQTQWEAPK